MLRNAPSRANGIRPRTAAQPSRQSDETSSLVRPSRAPMGTVMRATVREHREANQMDNTGRPRKLTDGQLHRTLSGRWGLTVTDLDQQLRRLAACW